MPRKFRTIAQVLYVCTWVAIVAIPITAAYMLLTTDPLELLKEEYLPLPDGGIIGFRLWFLLGVGLIPGLVMLYTLWQMVGLFNGFRRGEVITLLAAQKMGRLGKGLVAIAILTVLIVPVQSFLLTLNAPEGEHQVSLIIGGEDLWFVIAGGLMVLIGYALQEAVRLSDENKGFI